jgi:hypothetical protein
MRFEEIMERGQDPDQQRPPRRGMDPSTYNDKDTKPGNTRSIDDILRDLEADYGTGDEFLPPEEGDIGAGTVPSEPSTQGFPGVPFPDPEPKDPDPAPDPSQTPPPPDPAMEPDDGDIPPEPEPDPQPPEMPDPMDDLLGPDEPDVPPAPEPDPEPEPEPGSDEGPTPDPLTPGDDVQAEPEVDPGTPPEDVAADAVAKGTGEQGQSEIKGGEEAPPYKKKRTLTNTGNTTNIGVGQAEKGNQTYVIADVTGVTAKIYGDEEVLRQYYPDAEIYRD